MAYVAIEIVDAGLVAVRDGAVLGPSPGIALLDPEGVITGREAAAQARLRPVFSCRLMCWFRAHRRYSGVMSYWSA